MNWINKLFLPLVALIAIGSIVILTNKSGTEPSYVAKPKPKSPKIMYGIGNLSRKPRELQINRDETTIFAGIEGNGGFYNSDDWIFIKSNAVKKYKDLKVSIYFKNGFEIVLPKDGRKVPLIIERFKNKMLIIWISLSVPYTFNTENGVRVAYTRLGTTEDEVSIPKIDLEQELTLKEKETDTKILSPTKKIVTIESLPTFEIHIFEEIHQLD